MDPDRHAERDDLRRDATLESPCSRHDPSTSWPARASPTVSLVADTAESRAGPNGRRPRISRPLVALGLSEPNQGRTL
jgi:hypothetical protein